VATTTVGTTADNTLYYGDNLDILREHIPTASIDLVYLDPPFNSNRNYNVLFKDESGKEAEAQITAFEDTWHWGPDAEATYRALTTEGNERVATMIDAMRKFIGANEMMAYLVMMTARLVELQRVLKPTGSIYLHCDPTASHYLKIIMDAIFDPGNFRNEIIWKRTSAHSGAKRYGPVHDTILFYGKSPRVEWVGGYQAYDETYVRERFNRGGERPWKDADLTGSGTRNGETGLPWRNFNPTAIGRHWGYLPSDLDQFDADGRIYWPPKGGWPRLKRFLEDTKGIPLQDVWTDVRACPQTSHLSPSRFDRSQDPLVPSTHDPASTSGHPTLRTRPRAVPEGEQPHEGGGRVLRRPPQPPMWSPLGRKRDLGAGGFVDTL